MASIIFKPGCSNCGKLITESESIVYTGSIFVGSDPVPYMDNDIYQRIRLHLQPEVCPHCGEPFDKVIVPKLIRMLEYLDKLGSNGISTNGETYSFTKGDSNEKQI